MRTNLIVTEEPQMRYSRKGLEICTLREDGQRYVAFGETAICLESSVSVGDNLTLNGYMKPFTWNDAEGGEYTREDFVITGWEFAEK